MNVCIGGTALRREEGDSEATLLRISDDLTAILDFVSAAWMAAGTLDQPDCNPIQAALHVAPQLGADLRERIDAAREARAEGE